jgi:hypothetical protein
MKTHKAMEIATISLAAILVAGQPAWSETIGTPLPTYEAMGARVRQPAEGDADNDVDAVSGATTQGGEKIQPSFFGISVPLEIHRTAGYVSGGLLAAAGGVGAYRFLTLKERSHAYRDSHGGSGREDSCSDVISDEWSRDQAIRWTHVGLVASGEALYLFDAATGISLMKYGEPTRNGAAAIHRTAFFAHAALMAADVVTGILLTNALANGEHDAVVGYGAAHAGIGIAIPVVIIGSGLAVDMLPKGK